MNIEPIYDLLLGSPFEDKAAEISSAFSSAGVKTLDELDNAPRLLGSSVAGYSAYQVCSFLRGAAIEREIQGSVPIVPEEVLSSDIYEVDIPDDDPAGLFEEE